MHPAYDRVARRANHRCEYCHAPEQAFNFPFDVEHIQPKSQGGNDQDENLALACRSCNLYKGNRVQAVDPSSQQQTRLFHPRIDQWNSHFSLVQPAQIAGTTALGRATVSSLNMNAPAQLCARELWIRWQLFP